MAQVTEAVYQGGVLKPIGKLDLQEQQRVHLIVEAIQGGAAPDRAAALRRLRSGIEEMQFYLSARLPRREELHDRA